MSDPLPIARLHHLSYQVADLERSLAFYRDLLGFRPIARPQMRFSGAWLYRDGLQIHLIADQDFTGTAGPIDSTDDHIAFFAPSLQAVESALHNRQIPYRKNVQSGSGLQQLFFHDPDGRTIECAEYPHHPDTDPPGA